jgi:hypothetical protein
MKNEYSLSIIIPGVRNERWELIYNQIKESCRKYSYEIIFVSPYPLPAFFLDKTNVKYLKDLSTPARALQLGSVIAEGQFMTWISDDALIEQDSLDLAIDLLLSKNAEKDIVGMRYTEGQNFSGQPFPDEYWESTYHGDTRLPGIDPSWKIPGVYLISLDYFRQMGGLDCRFEHANFNVHDLSFRSQRNGSNVYLSPSIFMRCDWDPNRNPHNSAVIAAYHYNDLPLFRQIYSTKESADNRQIFIDYSNWSQIPSIWHRRHNVKTGI